MILVGIFGFICGIGLASFFHFSLSFIFLFLAVLLSLLTALHFTEEKYRRHLKMASVIGFTVLLGIGRMYFSPSYAVSQLGDFENKQVVLTGIIVDEPDVRENGTKLSVSVREISSGVLKINSREKVLVSTSLYPEFRYGDKVSIRTTLVRPTKIDSPDGRVFDYPQYLRARGIFYITRFSNVTLISSSHGSYIKSWLFKMKYSFTDSLKKVLPEPQVSLLSGLLLGSKQSLGTKLLDEFRRTGVSHIVVLSGYNIAIVAQSIISVSSFLPQFFSVTLGAIGIILFSILSGGGASAVRACIMVLVVLLAKNSNREYQVDKAFLLAVVVMLLFNPLLLVFDPSFQLSALATIGLIFVSPYIAPYMTRVTEKYGTREILSSTIATHITVLPFLIYNTGIVSLVSVPVNLLVLGTIPTTMLLGFVTGIVGFVSAYLAYIPALPTFVLLWYQLFVVHIGASIPFGSVTLPAFSPLVLVFVYGGIFFILQKIKNKKPQ